MIVKFYIPIKVWITDIIILKDFNYNPWKLLLPMFIVLLLGLAIITSFRSSLSLVYLLLFPLLSLESSIIVCLIDNSRDYSSKELLISPLVWPDLKAYLGVYCTNICFYGYWNAHLFYFTLFSHVQSRCRCQLCLIVTLLKYV